MQNMKKEYRKLYQLPFLNCSTVLIRAWIITCIYYTCALFLITGQPQKTYSTFVSKASKLLPTYFEIILKVMMDGWMDGWMYLVVLHPFQQYFSHSRKMGG